MDGRSKTGVAKTRITDKWLRKHCQIYNEATRHPFILSIGDGTVNLSAFKRWLGQAYLFVHDFAAFGMSVVEKAWNHSGGRDGDADVIENWVSALYDEIQWFKKGADRWGVDLSDVVPEKPTEDYCRFLEGLKSPHVDYAVVMSAFWAIEAVYQESFAFCLEEGSRTPPEIREACLRRGYESFGHYSLRNIADRRLQEVASHILPSMKVREDVVGEAERTFRRVLQYQVGFWNMSGGVPRDTAQPFLEKCNAHSAPFPSHTADDMINMRPSQHVAPDPAPSETIAPAASMRPNMSYQISGNHISGNTSLCTGVIQLAIININNYYLLSRPEM